ncbi:hypothetical protein LTS18_005187 [Coniosporium uncinatum]|uniref:Uncharacterized protein n=1 Tax=Coniosporium uncinatum TaxID=93489 RepID=A0ACC3D5D0_9PEZI|nr:hypothetical protein LTS18_005187 [Coniosporium uncinatum]
MAPSRVADEQVDASKHWPSKWSIPASEASPDQPADAAPSQSSSTINQGDPANSTGASEAASSSEQTPPLAPPASSSDPQPPQSQQRPPPLPPSAANHTNPQQNQTDHARPKPSMWPSAWPWPLKPPHQWSGQSGTLPNATVGSANSTEASWPNHGRPSHWPPRSKPPHWPPPGMPTDWPPRWPVSGVPPHWPVSGVPPNWPPVWPWPMAQTLTAPSTMMTMASSPSSSMVVASASASASSAVAAKTTGRSLTADSYLDVLWFLSHVKSIEMAAATAPCKTTTTVTAGAAINTTANGGQGVAKEKGKRDGMFTMSDCPFASSRSTSSVATSSTVTITQTSAPFAFAAALHEREAGCMPNVDGCVPPRHEHEKRDVEYTMSSCPFAASSWHPATTTVTVASPVQHEYDKCDVMYTMSSCPFAATTSHPATTTVTISTSPSMSTSQVTVTVIPSAGAPLAPRDTKDLGPKQRLQLFDHELAKAEIERDWLDAMVLERNPTTTTAGTDTATVVVTVTPRTVSVHHPIAHPPPTNVTLSTILTLLFETVAFLGFALLVLLTCHLFLARRRGVRERRRVADEHARKMRKAERVARYVEQGQGRGYGSFAEDAGRGGMAEVERAGGRTGGEVVDEGGGRQVSFAGLP